MFWCSQVRYCIQYSVIIETFGPQSDCKRINQLKSAIQTNSISGFAYSRISQARFCIKHAIAVVCRILYDLLVAFALHRALACFLTALATGDDCDFRISLRIDVRSRKTGCPCETRLLLFISLDICSSIRYITTPSPHLHLITSTPSSQPSSRSPSTSSTPIRQHRHRYTASPPASRTHTSR
jgi:hypothetical protein